MLELPPHPIANPNTAKTAKPKAFLRRRTGRGRSKSPGTTRLIARNPKRRRWTEPDEASALMVKVAVPLVVAELSDIWGGETEQEILALAPEGTLQVRATEPVNPFVPPTTTDVLPLKPTAPMVTMVGLAPMLNP